jgi:hypothetical protein
VVNLCISYNVRLMGNWFSQKQEISGNNATKTDGTAQSKVVLKIRSPERHGDVVRLAVEALEEGKTYLGQS